MKTLNISTERLLSWPQTNKGNDVSVTEVDSDNLDALIQRVTDAKDNNLSLEPEDTQLLLDALMTLAHLQERLSDNNITLNKLRKLLGMVKSSEKLNDLISANGNEPDNNNKKKHTQKKPKGKTKKPVKPTVIHHSLGGVKKGDACPECPTGKLTKYEPATLLRIVGHSPFSAEQHVAERLRCNACGLYITAPLPKEVIADGSEQQKYGFSARSVMGLQRYFAGAPFYRQESLQALLGLSITASTIYDQCEYLANALFPVANLLQRLAGNASHLYLDDTHNRILNQKPVMKKPRNGGKEQLRSGIYTSGLIATTNDGYNIALFKTNIGHAGEWLDEILAHRDSNRLPPILMSDALSRNAPSRVAAIATLCNAHARRQYVDVLQSFPQEVEVVLERYKSIWVNDDFTFENAYSPDQRLDYHKEHSLPVMNHLREWGRDMLLDGSVEENSGLGKAIGYFEKHFDGLTGFCLYENAKLDNNKMEAQLKLIIRGRKNSMFYKTLAGAAVGDVITSVIATAADAGINVFDYFNAVQRHSDKVKADPETWLPWNYQV